MGRIGERSIALFLLALVLFSSPLLTIFSSESIFLGIPLLYLYIFVAWVFVILLIALNMARGGHPRGSLDQPRPTYGPGREEG